MKITNKQVREKVEDLKPFKANTMYACWMNTAYVVFSYGTHWPLYIFYRGNWYENEERYSVTTSRHRNLARPYQADHFKVSCKQARSIVDEALTSPMY